MKGGTPRVEGVRLRPPALALLAAAGILVAGAVLLRNPAPMLAALPLLLAPVIAVASRPDELRLEGLRWQVGGIGSDLEVDGVVAGRFGASASGIAVVPRPPAAARLARPPVLTPSATEVRFAYAYTLAHPAITEVPPPRVVWREPLGLADHVLVAGGTPLPLERYPPELRRLSTIRLDRTLQLPGEARSRRIGPTGEFFGIRDAAPDEPPRQINWRASARTGRLLANDFQLDRTGDLLLLLDVRPTAYGPAVDEELLGVARAGVLGIAESLLRGKVRVGYAAFGEFVSAVPLSTGRTQRIRIQQALLASRRAPTAAPPDRCTFGLRRYFRPGLTTLVVSAWSGERAFDLLPYLRRAGYPAAMVSPSPLSLRRERGSAPVEFEEEVARRLEDAERRARLGALWEHGPVVDWTDHWSLETLVRFLQSPSRRRVA